MAFYDVERETALYFARLSENLERYEEMKCHMKEVILLGCPLSNAEREYFAIAYKAVLDRKRISHDKVLTIERKHPKGSSKRKIAEDMRKRIEQEIISTCDEMIHLLTIYLVPVTYDPTATMIYFQLKGDCCRYIAEIAEGELKQTVIKGAMVAYDMACKVADSYMTDTDPYRLSMILNFAIFYNDIMDDPEEAYKMAKTAFEEGVKEYIALESNIKDVAKHLKSLNFNMKGFQEESVKQQRELDEQQQRNAARVRQRKHQKMKRRQGGLEQPHRQHQQWDQGDHSYTD